MAWMEQRGDSWRVVWRHDGARQSTTWPDEETAGYARGIIEAHRHNLTKRQLEDLVLGPVDPDDGPPPSDCPLLADWWAEWHPSRTRPAPRQMGEYRAMWEGRILPALGHLHMDHITGVEVGRFIHDLRTTPAPRAPNGLSEARVTKYFTELSACFAAAIRAQRRTHVTVNPCAETDFKRIRPGQQAHDDTGDDINNPVYLSAEQYRHLRAQFKPAYHPLLDVLYGTGARWSEATALSASAFTVPGRTGRYGTRYTGPQVQIHRAWKLDDQGRRYLGSTKGKSRRQVPPPSWLVPTLVELAASAGQRHADWRERMRRHARGEARSMGGKRAQERAAEMLELVKKPLLLTAPGGGPYDYGSFLVQVWNPAVAQAMRCPDHPPPDQGGPAPEGSSGTLCKDFGGTRIDGRPCGLDLVNGMTRCYRHMGPAPDAVSTCDCPGRLNERLTPHDLRHSHAAAYLHGGGQMHRLQRRLGHESITTTEIYAGLLPGGEELDVAALDAAWNG